jgi:hypothetical protein
MVFSALNFLFKTAPHQKNDSVSRVFASLFALKTTESTRRLSKKILHEKTQQNRISTTENAVPSGKQTPLRNAFVQCDLINGYFGKQNQKF